MPKASLATRLRPPRSSEDLEAGLATLDPWGPLTAVAAHLGLSSAGPLIMPPSALGHGL
jgi:hypothetical protein